MPKARYRLYHEERGEGAGSVGNDRWLRCLSRDSPPVFNNILGPTRTRCVPWAGSAELPNALPRRTRLRGDDPA